MTPSKYGKSGESSFLNFLCFDRTTVTVVDKTFVLNLKGVVVNQTPLESGVMGKFDSSLELPSKQVITTYWDLVQLQESEGKGISSQIKFDDGKGTILSIFILLVHCSKIQNVSENKLKYSGKYSRADGFTVPTYNLDGNLELSAAQKNLGVHYVVTNVDNSGTKSVSHKVLKNFI